ncbi:transcription-repair coupling factor [Litorimonas sp. RW-G-Af-16]|uniref:transcription-repair coupling factor n=1 Tax=Litorimonas sp. RW-G-Af-16 TaxID=3241168 RepID=UPI003AAA8318
MQIQLSRYCGPELDLIAAGLPEGADALVFAKAVQQQKCRGLFVARDDTRAAAFMAACRFFAPNVVTISLPAWDCLPYDRVSPGQTLAGRRAGALFSLLTLPTDQPSIIVTTASAAMQRTPPRDVIRSAGFSAKAGDQVKREQLENYLQQNGYSRASTVMEAGDFAFRGGIVDIFAPTEKTPIRLDFFGDELESIREFDVETQRTTETRSHLTLSPVSEVFMSEDNISYFRRGYIAAFGGGVARDPIYAAVVDGIRPQGIEHYLPLFYDQTETIFDYVGPQAFIAFDGLLNESKSERWDLIEDFYSSRKEHAEARDSGSGDPRKSAGLYRPLPSSALYIGPEDWAEIVAPLRTRDHTAFEPPDDLNKIDFNGKLARNFSPERRTEGTNVFEIAVEHLNKLRLDKQRVLVAAWTEGSRDRLASVLDDHNYISPKLDASRALSIKGGETAAVILPLEHGFTLGDLSVLSEQDILGDRLINRGRKRKAKNFIAEASTLTPGDLIIHLDHGLGRYIGLRTLQVSDAPHDCLELEYAGEAKLFLPVENIELLSRYGHASEGAVLDRLGGAAWQSRKAKAKDKLREMAAELIIIAAKRAMRTTEAIELDPGAYNEFSARFPYAETDDQLSAIDDVLADLSSGKPMDRLICGDVGFGKTEVALRGAFAVAMSGRQVAIVAPTTILSRQHFKTFSERFKGWPVKVRQLSRLVTAKEAALTKEELAAGRCEIVIGTHALLAKTIKFSDLGLVIVDEEQRFGVRHKERLKELRADVHMLTLTATPIPRTLQMALSGIRDLSLIATPPVDRLAVRTYVMPFDEISIRKALLRERYRGGQSYFVVPRIADIPRIEEFMRQAVPEVRYVIAHGQMTPSTLEDIMTAFYDGEYDVLISTSIIESGIDIPSANTMIIYRSDKFGLAQLYQMRGRVGRSKVRAYAYMTMPDEHVASPGALQRLKVLQSLDTLGAGFTLASHDLDLRGGGNPLGEEQSGHIKDLGVELYQHMLEEAVAELRSDIVVETQIWSPQVNLGVAVLIPDTYIEDLNLRLATYRRIAETESNEDADGLAAELIDRFGPLPDELQSLFKVMKIKRLCYQAHVSKVDAGPRGIILTMRHEDVKDPSIIMNAITQNNGWRLRPDQTVLVGGNFQNDLHRVQGAERAVKALISD